MTEPEPQSQPPNRPLRRRRRANVAQGRQVQHQVKLTEEEKRRLVELAGEQGVPLSRLLVESALASRGETPARRREAMVGLFELRYLLATVANNVNQLARSANISGEVPAGRLYPVLVELRGLAGRIDAALDGLAGR